MRNKKGQIKKIFVAVILIMLLATLILATQNNEGLQGDIETQISEVQEGSQADNLKIEEVTDAEIQQIDNLEIVADTEIELTDNTTKTIDLCENINCEHSILICQDNSTAICENSCISETGVCTFCNPICRRAEQISEDEIKNESEIIKNETFQLEQNETISTITGRIVETGIPQLDVQLIYPQKITRGGFIEIEITITNTGTSEVKNIKLGWQLSPEFEVILQKGNCETLAPQESCNIKINLKTSPSTMLGKNQIKVIVIYENE